MFGFKTVVVGNLPNTKLAAAIAAAKVLDGTKIDHTEIIRVYEWAWLGDWIAQVVAIKAVYELDRSVSLDTLTTEYSDLGGNYEGGDIPGAEQPESFYLSIGMACEQVGEFTRRECAYVAAESLVKGEEDELELVYSVILTEGTYTKANSKLMLSELGQKQWSVTGEGLLFKIRVFVVKDDGSFDMHKL